MFSCCTHTVLFPLLHPQKRKNSWTLPTGSPPLCPESNRRERRRKKKGRGGADEVKCVLKMAALPLAPQLHSHVCGRADVLREEGQAVVWKSKMAAAAPHHQTQLHSTAKSFKSSVQLSCSTCSNSLLRNKSKFGCIIGCHCQSG